MAEERETEKNVMINKKEFEDIAEDLKKFENKREEVIVLSRKIINLSKRIIYSMHRNNRKEAEVLLKEIRKEIKKLPKEPHDTSIALTAMQEYVEAVCYYAFDIGKTIPTRKELEVDTNEYLLGLCDLSGELVRKAVNSAINQDYNEVKRAKQFTEELYGEFLKFDLRNGELRKKYDSIRWNLAKLEDLLLSVNENRK